MAMNGNVIEQFQSCTKYLITSLTSMSLVMRERELDYFAIIEPLTMLIRSFQISPSNIYFYYSYQEGIYVHQSIYSITITNTECAQKQLVDLL